jgi:hypothetical protein
VHTFVRRGSAEKIHDRLCKKRSHSCWPWRPPSPPPRRGRRSPQARTRETPTPTHTPRQRGVVRKRSVARPSCRGAPPRQAKKGRRRFSGRKVEAGPPARDGALRKGTSRFMPLPLHSRLEKRVSGTRAAQCGRRPEVRGRRCAREEDCKGRWTNAAPGEGERPEGRGVPLPPCPPPGSRRESQERGRRNVGAVPRFVRTIDGSVGSLPPPPPLPVPHLDGNSTQAKNKSAGPAGDWRTETATRRRPDDSPKALPKAGAGRRINGPRQYCDPPGPVRRSVKDESMWRRRKWRGPQLRTWRHGVRHGHAPTPPHPLITAAQCSRDSRAPGRR